MRGKSIGVPVFARSFLFGSLMFQAVTIVGRLAFIIICAVSALIATGITDEAFANSIPINLNFSSPGGVLDFYVKSLTFSLPTGFSNPSLNLTNFQVDDRGVLELNGLIVASTGISGPGSGHMVLTSGGPNNPFTFEYGVTGPYTSITSGFVAGFNTLDVIVNNTNLGINGNLTTSGPTSINLAGAVTYDVSATPLPATLPLFASGLGALGLLGWHRKRKAAAAA